MAHLDAPPDPVSDYFRATLARQRLHLLNPTAAAIWTVLDSGLSLEDAASVLAAHSGRDPTGCAADIAAMEEQWAVDGTFGDLPAPPPGVPREHGNGDGVASWYEIGGVRLELTSEDAEVAARVAAALGERIAPPGEDGLRAAVRVEDGALVLYADGAAWLTSNDSGDVVGGVFHLLLQRLWGEHDWVEMIHGAALERDGGAIVMPAKSGAGKTTLAAYLSRRGYDLLADDLAAVRADGRVVPWSTQLNVKRGSWRALAEAVPELGGLPEQELVKRRVKLVATGRDRWDQPPVPVRALILPQWSQRNPAAVVRLDPLEALASLVDDRVWVG